MSLSKPGPSKTAKAGNTRNVHIGLERYSKLIGIAIEISYQVGDQVTPTQIAQYLVDHYSDMAKAEILRELHVSQIEMKTKEET
ncbi:hypothetical protein [Xylophilus sp.]|uniref:hypothetical protein n=1 Tax=Xylophilus sp. TaxID=2653893 RepID=UPI0013BE1A3B|nr:hypothetical protein [Xylophilus sp.]KAF1042238.1 MAG: hypothetical protein GAK38_04386 [Xylophilus sp.]